MAYCQSRIRRAGYFTLALLLCAHLGGALVGQNKKKPVEEPKQSGATFKMVVDLVSVNVNVTDKHGAPVTDLTEKDFQVLDNGVPQTISVFRMETIPGVAAPGSSSAPSSSESPTPGILARKVILYVDDYHTSFEDLVYVRKAGEQFIRTGLAPTDLVALITASGRFSTEFTKYRDYVIANLNQVSAIFTGRERSSECPPMNEHQAVQIESDQLPSDQMTAMINLTIGCAHLQTTPNAEMIARGLIQATAQRLSSQTRDESQRVFFALQTLTRRLRAISGPKELILLSPGFFVSTSDIYELQRTIDYAIRADTVIDSVNVKGLVPDISAVSRSPVNNYPELRFAENDPLSALASETGGKFYYNNNDLFSQMKAAVSRSVVNYILGFYPSNERRDGQFHKLAVKVNRPDVSVSARKGYFAPKGEESFEAMKNDDILDALQNPEALKGIPLALSYNITHDPNPRTLLEVRTQIDVRKIHFQKREARDRNTFAIVTIVYDSHSQFVDGRESRLDFNLTDPNYNQVMKEGLVIRASFRLDPGEYTVKSVVRDAVETKIGSTFKRINIGEQ